VVVTRTLRWLGWFVVLVVLAVGALTIGAFLNGLIIGELLTAA
jgi:hypothetical protein